MHYAEYLPTHLTCYIVDYQCGNMQHAEVSSQEPHGSVYSGHVLVHEVRSLRYQ